MEEDDDRPKRPSRTQSAVYSEGDDRETSLGKEKILFTLLIVIWEAFMLIIYGVWVRYVEDEGEANFQVLNFYDYFRLVFFIQKTNQQKTQKSKKYYKQQSTINFNNI